MERKRASEGRRQ